MTLAEALQASTVVKTKTGREVRIVVSVPTAHCIAVQVGSELFLTHVSPLKAGGQEDLTPGEGGWITDEVERQKVAQHNYRPTAGRPLTNEEVAARKRRSRR